MKKKFLSILLTLSMVLTMLPTFALATDISEVDLTAPKAPVVGDTPAAAVTCTQSSTVTATIKWLECNEQGGTYSDFTGSEGKFAADTYYKWVITLEPTESGDAFANGGVTIKIGEAAADTIATVADGEGDDEDKKILTQTNGVAALTAITTLGELKAPAAPVVGAVAADSITPSTSGVSAIAVAWTQCADQSGDYVAFNGQDNKFQAGMYYKWKITVTPDSTHGFKDDADSTITLSGATAELAADGKLVFTQTAGAKVLAAIASVDAAAPKIPVAGDTAASTVTCTTTGAGTPVVTWQTSSDGSNYETPGEAVTEFAADDTYYKWVITIPTDGDYAFTSETTTGLDDVASAEVDDDGKLVITQTAGAKAAAAIASVAVTAAPTAPVGGAKPVTTVTYTEDEKISKAEVTWLEKASSSSDFGPFEVEESTTFTAGKTYKWVITVTPAAGNGFTDAATATIADTDATGSATVAVDAAGKMTLSQTTGAVASMPAPADPEKEVIKGDDVTDKIYAAPLNDYAADNKVYDHDTTNAVIGKAYSVTGDVDLIFGTIEKVSASTDTYYEATLKMKDANTALKAHQNADGDVGYWIGVAFPEEDDATYEYYKQIGLGTGLEMDDAETPATWSKGKDGNETGSKCSTLYYNALSKEFATKTFFFVQVKKVSNEVKARNFFAVYIDDSAFQRAYAVELAAGENGEVAGLYTDADCTSAKTKVTGADYYLVSEGETVYVKATPAQDYELSAVAVEASTVRDGAKVAVNPTSRATAPEAAKVSDNIYSVTMPVGAGDLKISLTFAESGVTPPAPAKKTLSASDFTAENGTAAYTGEDQKASVLAVATIKSDFSDAQVTYSMKKSGGTVTEAVNVGTYTLCAAVTGDSKYEAVAEIELGIFEITKATTNEISVTIANITYGGTPNPTGVTATFGTPVLAGYADSESGEFGAWNTANGVKTWYARYTVANTDNYPEASKVVSFSVQQASLLTAVISPIADKTYSATESENQALPTVKITLASGEKTLVKDTDYDLTYENADAAGTATVTVTGKTNFKDAISATYTIKPAVVTYLSGLAPTKTYDGNGDYTSAQLVATSPKVKLASDNTNAEVANVSLDVGSATAKATAKSGHFYVASDYDLTITGVKLTGTAAGNYTFDNNFGELKGAITAAAETPTFTLSKNTSNLGKPAAEVTVNVKDLVTVSGLKLGDAAEITAAKALLSFAQDSAVSGFSVNATTGVVTIVAQTEGTYTVKVTVGGTLDVNSDGQAEYGEITASTEVGSFAITTSASTQGATITFERDEVLTQVAGLTYGDTVTDLAAYAVVADTTPIDVSGSNWTWTSSDPGVVSVTGTTNKPTITVLAASDQDVTLTAQFEKEVGSTTYSGSATLTIKAPAKKALTANDLTYQASGVTITKEYDGDTTVKSAGVLVLTDDPGATLGNVTFTYTDANAGDGNKTVTATMAASGFSSSKYELAADLEDIFVTDAATITPLALTDVVVTLDADTCKYLGEGVQVKPAITAISSAKAGELNAQLTGSDYDVTYDTNVAFGVNANNKVTVTNKTGGNYTFSVAKNFEITKGVSAITGTMTYSIAGAKDTTKDIAAGLSTTPADATLTYSSSSEAVATVSSAGVVTVAANAASATSVTITVSYAGSEKWDAASASVTVNIAKYTAPDNSGSSSSSSSSGSGGGGGGKTTVVTNPDGSKTSTTENADGSKTAVTTATNGSTGTVNTDKNGNVTSAAANVSAQAVTDAAKSGAAVALPVTVKAATSTSAAPAVKVTVPSTVSSRNPVAVEVPVSNVTSGTILVKVDANGNETIVTKSVVTADGVMMKVDGSVTLKVVNNAKSFNDTSAINREFQNAVAYVSSRELFNGTTPTSFAPARPMTRQMLFTVLAGLDGQDTSRDATHGAYDKGMAWAVANGISDGTNGAANLNRQQLAAMLYRYAGSPSVSGSQTASFKDAANVSNYAKAAMEWAVQNGILNGNNGNLNPTAPATRAQVATMLMRFNKSQI